MKRFRLWKERCRARRTERERDDRCDADVALFGLLVVGEALVLTGKETGTTDAILNVVRQKIEQRLADQEVVEELTAGSPGDEPRRS